MDTHDSILMISCSIGYGGIGATPVDYAIVHLIAFGAHNNTKRGRKLCADALRFTRKNDSREKAVWLKRHMVFIAGCLPQKEKE